MKTNIGKLTGFLLVMAALLAAPTDRAKAAELSAPIIHVDAPVSDAAVNSPVQVTLHFEAPNGSEIDVASFQALYRIGSSKKNITKHMLSLNKWPGTPPSFSIAPSRPAPFNTQFLLVGNNLPASTHSTFS